jgi:hypothetical protein
MLLPDPTKYKAPEKANTDYDKQEVFFSHSELDAMAKHFIGNMNR